MEQSFETSLIHNLAGAEEDFSPEVFRIISFKPGYHYKKHSHKRIELNYILQGNGTMMLENELVKLNKNNSILILPGFKHDFFVPSKTGIKIVQLEFQMSERILKAFTEWLKPELSFLQDPVPSGKSYFKIPNTPEIRDCMERIILEKKLKHSRYELLTRLYFIELVILLSRYINRQFNECYQTENTCLKKAMDIIHTDYCSALSVESIAEACQVTPRYLRKLFQKYLESSPKEYCNNLKIKKSMELLADQHLSVKEIAFSSGYSSPQYFSRVFKNKYGISPQTYRKVFLSTQP